MTMTMPIERSLRIQALAKLDGDETTFRRLVSGADIDFLNECSAAMDSRDGFLNASDGVAVVIRQAARVTFVRAALAETEDD